MGEMVRVWKNPGFWFAIVLGVLSMLYPHMDTHVFWEEPLSYFASGDFLYFMLMPLQYGLAKLLLPFIAVFPAATFLAEDQKRGHQLMMLHRAGMWGYMRRRIMLSAGGAVLAAALGFLVYAVFAGFACPWHENIVTSWRELSGYTFDAWVNQWEGLPFLVFSFLCLCVSAAVWSLFGFSIACFTNNTGLVIGGTFLLHYMASWCFGRILHHSEWSPMVLQAPSTYFTGSVWQIVFRLLVWLAISVIIAVGCAGWFVRRMKEA